MKNPFKKLNYKKLLTADSAPKSNEPSVKEIIDRLNFDNIDRLQKISNDVDTMLSQNPVFTVQDIHDSFDSASDKLVNEFNEIVTSEHFEANMLKHELGFTSAVSSGFNGHDFSFKKSLLKTIEEYKILYPEYKFITQNQVKELCEKYSLLFGETDRYTGDIPMKNLKEISHFVKNVKIRDEDSMYRVDNYMGSQWEVSFEDYKSYSNEATSRFMIRKHTTMSICAPAKDMSYSGRELREGYMIQSVPDPIVLYPVLRGYLIVSKWGLEGQDVSLTNETHN